MFRRGGFVLFGGGIRAPYALRALWHVQKGLGVEGIGEGSEQEQEISALVDGSNAPRSDFKACTGVLSLWVVLSYPRSRLRLSACPDAPKTQGRVGRGLNGVGKFAPFGTVWMEFRKFLPSAGG